MRKMEIGLTALLWVAATLLLPVAASEPCPEAADRALGACADGSAHLAMGCASVSL